MLLKRLAPLTRERMLFDSQLMVPALSHTSQTARAEQTLVRKDGAGGGGRASGVSRTACQIDAVHP